MNKIKSISRLFKVHTLAVIACMASVALPAFSVAPALAAGSGSFSLSPPSSSVNAGSNLTVTVYENSGTEAVNALQLNLKYPASLLQFVKADYGTSAFDVQAQSSGGNGVVAIARGASKAPLSGNHVVGVITFKAVAGGTAAVTFECIYNKSTCSKGDALVSSANNTNILSSQASESYVIAGSAPAPSSASSSSSSASGSTVTIVVQDSSGKLVQGASVTMDGQVVPTDLQGQAVFNNVPAGSQQVTINSGGKSTKESIQVSSGQKNQPQLFKLATAGSSNSARTAIAALVIVIILLVLAYVLRKRMGTDSPAVGQSTPGAQSAAFWQQVVKPKNGKGDLPSDKQKN